MYSTKVSVCLIPIGMAALIVTLKRWSEGRGVAELYRMFTQALCSLPEVTVLSALRFATALGTPLLPRLTHPGAEVMRSTFALPLAVLLFAYVPDAASQQLPPGCGPLKGEARQELMARFTEVHRTSASTRNVRM